tara:strand:+ start:63 stop:2036 length:1974 start_codon:yes stop_codon:yes gene_type:complete
MNNNECESCGTLPANASWLPLATGPCQWECDSGFDKFVVEGEDDRCVETLKPSTNDEPSSSLDEFSDAQILFVQPEAEKMDVSEDVSEDVLEDGPEDNCNNDSTCRKNKEVLTNCYQIMLKKDCGNIHPENTLEDDLYRCDVVTPARARQIVSYFSDRAFVIEDAKKLTGFDKKVQKCQKNQVFENQKCKLNYDSSFTDGKEFFGGVTLEDTSDACKDRCKQTLGCRYFNYGTAHDVKNQCVLQNPIAHFPGDPFNLERQCENNNLFELSPNHDLHRLAKTEMGSFGTFMETTELDAEDIRTQGTSRINNLTSITNSYSKKFESCATKTDSIACIDRVCREIPLNFCKQMYTSDRAKRSWSDESKLAFDGLDFYNNTAYPCDFLRPKDVKFNPNTSYGVYQCGGGKETQKIKSSCEKRTDKDCWEDRNKCNDLNRDQCMQQNDWCVHKDEVKDTIPEIDFSENCQSKKKIQDNLDWDPFLHTYEAKQKHDFHYDMAANHSTFRGAIYKKSVVRMPRYEYKYNPDITDLNKSYNGTAGSCERLCSRDPRCTGYYHKGTDCLMYSEEYRPDSISPKVKDEETVKFKKNYTLARKDQCNLDCLEANVICPFDFEDHPDKILNMCCTKEDEKTKKLAPVLNEFVTEINNGDYNKLCEKEAR